MIHIFKSGVDQPVEAQELPDIFKRVQFGSAMAGRLGWHCRARAHGNRRRTGRSDSEARPSARDVAAHSLRHPAAPHPERDTGSPVQKRAQAHHRPFGGRQPPRRIEIPL
jgi:hypothetical protein